MRFCVVGAGAMGGVYGLSLIESGYKVICLDVNRDHVNEIKENGFLLSGKGKQKVHKKTLVTMRTILKIALILSYFTHIQRERNLQLVLLPPYLNLMVTL